MECLFFNLSEDFSLRCRNQLFCTLTNCYLNRKPVEVEGHLAGKRYKTALEKCKSITWLC